MRPSTLLTRVFIALVAIACALVAGVAWVLLFSEVGLAPEARWLVLAGAGLAFLVCLVIGWVILQLRLARPIDALTREVQTLLHAKSLRTLEMPDGHCTGELSSAVHDLVEKLISSRAKRQHEISEALDRGDAYKRRLETILLDLSEGVIVCNLDNRVTLYNQAALNILQQPEALGLGRRLFGIFEREPILKALEELTRKQRDDKTRKLNIRKLVKCERLDNGKHIDARLALICSDEVETEGYVLSFTSKGVSGQPDDTALPPRPEFYDFDLFKSTPDREVSDIPLSELRYVVFDTETTGLNPSKGDELISIGAVRITNRRLLRSETFLQLIDPGMKIPEASIKFHGITDKDVKNSPRAKRALPKFHRFCGRAVLVAHNAAFDMKFLEMKEKESGVRFESPVLDVLLLSTYLHDHTKDHSLDATARRLGIETEDRHTALGDAMTTAEIFLAMLDPLAERGVMTLGDALKVSNEQVKVRKMQARF